MIKIILNKKSTINNFRETINNKKNSIYFSTLKTHFQKNELQKKLVNHVTKNGKKQKTRK